VAVFFPHYNLAKSIGHHRLELDAHTVRDLLAVVETRFAPSRDEMPKNVTILVNGRSINHLAGLDTVLQPADEVWFMLPSGGG
jgi:molybdopterin converting factor small subunit